MRIRWVGRYKPSRDLILRCLCCQFEYRLSLKQYTQVCKQTWMYNLSGRDIDSFRIYTEHEISHCPSYCRIGRGRTKLIILERLVYP
jgi:hypothetical protein